MQVPLAVLASLVLLLWAPAAQPVNLGGFEVQSSLGQRLRMIVQLNAREDEQLDATCFKVNPFNVATDGLPQLTSAQVVLERSNGGARLLVSSPRPIDDPIFRLSIEVGCDMALRRDLTVLLDPPPAIENVAVTPSPSPATASAPARPAQAPTSPATEAGTGRAGGTAPAAAAAAAGSRPPRPDSTSAPAGRASAMARPGEAESSAARTAAPARAAASLRPALRREGGPRAPKLPAAARGAARDRLTISASGPVDPILAAPLTPHLTLATTLSERTGQPPLPDSVLSIVRQKQARLRAAPASEDMPSLEAELVVLQKRAAELRTRLDAAMAQMQTLAGKQAAALDATAAPAKSPDAATPVQSLPQAAVPQSSFDSRWIFGGLLLLLLALFSAGLVFWIRRERAERRRQDRWNQSPYVPVTRVSTVVPPPQPARPASPGTSAAAATPRPVDERATPPESYAFMPFSAPHAASQLGVSDLAQATEKASVFVTLGRPEQAIDVLRDHIDHEDKPSPMAWLMLIDLYRQTGRRAEFTDVAERFHRTFNAETPQWDQPTDRTDEGLSAFPNILGSIRKDWPHAESLACIEALLYDNRGGGRIGFSLPAFRDLLLLHSLLEDYLSDAAGRGKADNGETAVPDEPRPPTHLAKAWASAPVPARSERREPKLELDVNLLSDSPDCSALESGLPAVAEAIISRWHKPGVANYLTNLIALSKDDRNSDVSTEMMGELLMLQDVASVLEEARARDLSL